MYIEKFEVVLENEMYNETTIHEKIEGKIYILLT
tara:strand:+ start:893 stop:994 length:102 start_codon:yes stop_codon:yes gene_type:complete